MWPLSRWFNRDHSNANSRKSKSLLKGHADTEEVAVVLVDMQTKFVTQLRNREMSRIIPNQLKVIDFCSKRNIPVVVLEYSNCGDTVNKLKARLKKVRDVTVIEKHFDDGFHKTNLNKVLKKRKIKTIIFMGINADCCVKDTASTAVSLGYKILTSNDLISGQPHHSTDNSAWWYEKNGLYFGPIRDLL